MLHGTKGKDQSDTGTNQEMTRNVGNQEEAMKDLPGSHKTWSGQHLIYFELLAYKTIKKKKVCCFKAPKL